MLIQVKTGEIPHGIFRIMDKALVITGLFWARINHEEKITLYGQARVEVNHRITVCDIKGTETGSIKLFEIKTR